MVGRGQTKLYFSSPKATQIKTFLNVSKKMVKQFFRFWITIVTFSFWKQMRSNPRTISFIFFLFHVIYRVIVHRLLQYRKKMERGWRSPSFIVHSFFLSFVHRSPPVHQFFFKLNKKGKRKKGGEKSGGPFN